MVAEVDRTARASRLADRFEHAHRDTVQAVEEILEQRWNAICDDTGWPVNVQACHIADATVFLTGVIGQIARGEEMAPIPMAAIDQENAHRAEAHAEATKDEALSALQASGTSFATFVRGLSDEQLDRAGVLVQGIPPMSVEQIVAQTAMGELLNHGGALRRAGAG
jgi:hypothetical protein